SGVAAVGRAGIRQCQAGDQPVGPVVEAQPVGVALVIDVDVADAQGAGEQPAAGKLARLAEVGDAGVQAAAWRALALGAEPAHAVGVATVLRHAVGIDRVAKLQVDAGAAVLGKRWEGERAEQGKAKRVVACDAAVTWVHVRPPARRCRYLCSRGPEGWLDPCTWEWQLMQPRAIRRSSAPGWPASEVPVCRSLGWRTC